MPDETPSYVRQAQARPVCCIRASRLTRHRCFHYIGRAPRRLRENSTATVKITDTQDYLKFLCPGVVSVSIGVSSVLAGAQMVLNILKGLFVLQEGITRGPTLFGGLKSTS